MPLEEADRRVKAAGYTDRFYSVSITQFEDMPLIFC